MNTYYAQYKNKDPIEIFAETILAAQIIAAEKFGARKSYEVSVHLVKTSDGREITQVITA